MYRWKRGISGAIAITLLAGAAKAETCREAMQQDLLCFTSMNDVPPDRSEPVDREQTGAAFWDGTVSHTTGRGIQPRPLPENAGITARTDAWGKTTYYNRYGQSIGSSTTDITGQVHYRDQNGTEVDYLW